MATPYDVGGGGNPSATEETTDQVIYDKPYELVGEPDSGMVNKIDEMFSDLYHGVGALDYIRRFGGFPPEYFSLLSEQLNILNTGKPGITSPTRNTEWLDGPWTINRPVPFDLDETVIVPDTSALPVGTYNDYAPPGIDKAIAIELFPAGDMTITGLRQYDLVYRLIFIHNRSVFTVTLESESTSSTPKYRFALPGNADVVLERDEGAVLYYSPRLQKWTYLVTPNSAGGFASATGTSVTTSPLSNAMLVALSATPLTLVAPVAGYVIIPLNVTISTNCTVAFSSAPTWLVQWSGITGVTIMSASSNLTSTSKRLHDMAPSSVNPSGANYPGGLGLVLRHDVALTGAGTVTGFVTTTYALSNSV